MLRVYLLGEFRIEVDGVAIADTLWKRRQAKQVIKLLALAPQHTLRKESIIEALWSELDREAGRSRLYLMLHVARRLLHPGRGRRAAPRYMHSSGESVSLGRPEDVWVDVVAFRRTLADVSLSADPLVQYQDALQLYRGHLLDEDLDQTWATAEREALARAYGDALIGLARLHGERGHYEVAVGCWRKRLEVAPCDEDAYRGLMQALAKAGRHGEVVLQYQRCREVLQRELNVEPSSATTQLFESLQRDQAVRLTPSDSPNGQRVYRIANADTPLIGRGDCITSLRALLDRTDVRLVTITGVAGVGKTRLAQEIAREMQPLFAHGACWVDLCDLLDHRQLEAHVCRALGVTEKGKLEPGEALIRYMEDKQLLLVLDNFEHILPAAPHVASWLGCTSGLAVVTTSRAALNLRGEHLFEVPPLPLPDSELIDRPDSLARVPAVGLFVARATARDQQFRLTADNAAAVAALCIRLDGLPLALELAAARTPTFSAAELLARIDKRFALLAHGPQDVADRHRSLQACIDWSYELLSPDARRVFAWLAVFSGGFSLEAAEQVCEQQGAEIADVLSELIQHHLLARYVDKRAGSAYGARFAQLESIRAYGRERLAERGELLDAQRRHATYFLSLAEQTAPALRRRHEASVLDALEREHANFRASLTWAVSVGDADTALRLSGALKEFWIDHGHFRAGRTWIDAALALACDKHDAPRARAMHVAGWLAYHQGDFVEARALHSRSLDVARSLADGLLTADALVALATAAYMQSDNELARRCVDECLPMFRELEDDRGISQSLNMLGVLSASEGKFDQAIALYEENIALCHKLGNVRGEAVVKGNIASLAHRRGDYTRAMALLTESLALARSLNQPWRIAHKLWGLGALAAELRNDREAQDLLAESLRLFRELGDRYYSAAASSRLGILAFWRGETARARELLRDELDHLIEAGDPDEASYALRFLALEALSRGDLETARARLRQILTLSQRAEPWVTLRAIETAGALGVAANQANLAARLLRYATGERQRLGVPLPPAEHPHYERLLADIRTNLGQRTFAATWSSGRAFDRTRALRNVEKLVG